MMLNKNKVEEAAKKYIIDNRYTNEGCNLYADWATKDFKSGVSYAESQLSELAIDLLDFLLNNLELFDEWSRSKISSEKVFNQFIKEYYG